MTECIEKAFEVLLENRQYLTDSPHIFWKTKFNRVHSRQRLGKSRRAVVTGSFDSEK